MVERFRVLDPSLKAPLPGQPMTQDFTSELLGFRVRCSNSAWMPWRNMEVDCQYASFGVLHRQDAALAVSAVSLMDLQPEPVAVYRGMLALITKQDVLKDSRPAHDRGLDGIETTFQQQSSSGKEYTYRLKVLQGAGLAYMVAAWTGSANPNKNEILNDALSRVEFLDPHAEQPAATAMSSRDKRVHRMFLNSIGTFYFAAQRFDQ